MEDIDGGLHPAVDGQNLDEDELCEFILQYMAVTLNKTDVWHLWLNTIYEPHCLWTINHNFFFQVWPPCLCCWNFENLFKICEVPEKPVTKKDNTNIVATFI